MSEEPRRERKRKSGWDVVEPAAAPQPSLTPAIPPVQAVQPIQQLMLPSLGTLGSTPAAINIGPDQSLAKRIYVGSLHYEIGQAEIMALFSCFGTITKCDLSHDPITGRSKGFCFVEFSDISAAQAALAMDGFEIANRKVSSIVLL